MSVEQAVTVIEIDGIVFYCFDFIHEVYKNTKSLTCSDGQRLCV